MVLKEVYWRCECGTQLRYWNLLRQRVHEASRQHQRWVIDGVVKEKICSIRGRKGDGVVVERLSTLNTNESGTK